MAIVINGSNNTISGLAVGGLPDGIVDTDMLAAGAATQAKRTYATNEIIQIKTDIRAGNYVDAQHPTQKQMPFGADLEVSITFSSLSNICYVSVFIPDIYNFATGTRSLHAGISYSTDNFSTKASIGNDNLSTHINYHGANDAFLNPTSYDTSVACPTTSPIKIRPHFSPNTGDIRLMANAVGVAQITVMEIKG